MTLGIGGPQADFEGDTLAGPIKQPEVTVFEGRVAVARAYAYLSDKGRMNNDHSDAWILANEVMGEKEDFKLEVKDYGDKVDLTFTTKTLKIGTF